MRGILCIGAAAIVLTACAPATNTPTTVTVTRTVAVPGSAVPGSAPTSAPTSTTGGIAETISSDGTYQVGVDILPGTYKTDGPKPPFGVCTWWRLKDLNNTDASTIDIGNEMGSSFVTIQPGDAAFKTQACLPWRKVS